MLCFRRALATHLARPPDGAVASHAHFFPCNKSGHPGASETSVPVCKGFCCPHACTFHSSLGKTYIE
jgi:hypothetical protein